MPSGTYTAMPCAYCDDASKCPVLTFKEMRSPLKGVPAMIAEYNPGSHETWTCWLEPELQGQRMVAVIDPKYRCFLWSEKGLAVNGSWPMIKLEAELVHLAIDLRWIGNKAWQAGVAMELLYVPAKAHELIQAYVCHAMPVTGLLDLLDTLPQGQRRQTLQQAYGEVDYSFLKLMPQQVVTTRPSLDADLLNYACEEWGVNSILIKQSQAKWGQTNCWLRFQGDF